jgi:hypothetical protein
MPSELLAVLALSRVPIDYPLKVDGYDLTVADLVEYEQLQCASGVDQTLRLIALAHYLDSDASWKNQQGQVWDLSRLIAAVLQQPVIRGSHEAALRMLALSGSLRKREKSGEAIEGPWLLARNQLRPRQTQALEALGNTRSEGDDLVSPGVSTAQATEESVRRIVDSLEWLAYALPGDQLRDPRVVRSVEELCQLLMSLQADAMDRATWAHALHTLAVYAERVYGSKPGSRPFLHLTAQSNDDEAG